MNRHDAAFPIVTDSGLKPKSEERDGRVKDRGLTKLEYAAIQIAAGLAVNSSVGPNYSFAPHAQAALGIANVLFDALEKEKG